MPNILKYVLRIILSIFINIVFIYLIQFLILSFYATSPAGYLTAISFGFWNGLIIGVIPFDFVRKFQKILALSFLASFVNSALLILYVISFNKLTGVTDTKLDSFIILMILYFGVVCGFCNLFSIFLLNKTLPHKI